jgi:hypothetical protein
VAPPLLRASQQQRACLLPQQDALTSGSGALAIFAGFYAAFLPALSSPPSKTGITRSNACSTRCDLAWIFSFLGPSYPETCSGLPSEAQSQNAMPTKDKKTFAPWERRFPVLCSQELTQKE